MHHNKTLVMIKNKKGLLLAEETLKIIIAVIAIGFLGYLLVSLYFSAKTSKELEQAESSLNFLLSETQSGSVTIDIYNPKNWWLISSSGELCICKDEERTSCREEGICSQSAFTFENNIKIKDPPITLSINQQSKIISQENGTG